MFCSYIQPIFDEDECKKFGLQPVTQEVLDKTNIKIEDLKQAPSLKSVWGEFIQYINKYNPKKPSKWGAPIKAGMNIYKYDNIIIDRICGGNFFGAQKAIDRLATDGIIKEGLKIPEPYGFGPWGAERGEEELFYPRDSIDLMHIIWMWVENDPQISSLSMDSMRSWLGISSEGAHTADKDVLDGSHMLIKFLKLHRNFAPKVKFKDSFKKMKNEK